MKKLNITKDKFTESKYFTTKYGTLKYVSESGNLYKTDKGHVLKFNESNGDSYEMDYYEIDDEMVKICEKYHDQIMTGYDALIQFNREIEDYAPTCQYELDEAINNLKVVTQWVHMGANDQFYT